MLTGASQANNKFGGASGDAGIGACDTTILLPGLDRNSLLGAIADGGQVERQTLSGTEGVPVVPTRRRCCDG